MQSVIRQTLLLAIVGLLGSGYLPDSATAGNAPAAPDNAILHTYHSSILELRINPKQQQVELALKVFTDDLENALSQGRPQRLSLQDPRTQALADAYLRDHLALALPATASRQPRLPLTLQFVGMQPEKDAYWLYAKAKLPRTATEVWLRNTVMLDLFSDQMNIVNAENGPAKVSELYRAGHEQAVLTLK